MFHDTEKNFIINGECNKNQIKWYVVGKNWL